MIPAKAIAAEKCVPCPLLVKRRRAHFGRSCLEGDRESRQFRLVQRGYRALEKLPGCTLDIALLLAPVRHAVFAGEIEAAVAGCVAALKRPRPSLLRVEQPRRIVLQLPTTVRERAQRVRHTGDFSRRERLWGTYPADAPLL